MVALPFVMMWVMDDVSRARPAVAGHSVPLALLPVVLGRFIPLTVSARTVIKIGFLMVVVGDAIWLTPHGFVPTGAKLVADLELPSDWNFLALMPAKNSAAFTLVFVTVVNYIIYNRAISQGTIVWGKIDFASQFVLDFSGVQCHLDHGTDGGGPVAAYENISIRTICCRTSRAESFTPTLSYSAWWITAITVAFYRRGQLGHACDAPAVRGERRMRRKAALPLPVRSRSDRTPRARQRGIVWGM